MYTSKHIRYDFNPSIRFPAYLTRKRLLEGIEKFAPSLGGRLLDFGCGSKPYQSLFQVDQYVGLDIENNPGHSHENEQIDVFYDGKRIPFDDATFDAVFTSEVFEHVFNIDEALKEVNRILKIGGKMIVTCPFAICEHEAPNDFARYTSYGLKHILQQNGFEVIEFVKAGTSIEVIVQLWIMYIHQNIYPKIKKIPILSSIFCFATYVFLNGLALILNKLLPDKRNDLYLNNIVLCYKINNV